MIKEYCIYCGKELVKKQKSKFFSSFTGKRKYNRICSNPKCPDIIRRNEFEKKYRI